MSKNLRKMYENLRKISENLRKISENFRELSRTHWIFCTTSFINVLYAVYKPEMLLEALGNVYKSFYSSRILEIFLEKFSRTIFILISMVCMRMRTTSHTHRIYTQHAIATHVCTYDGIHTYQRATYIHIIIAATLARILCAIYI